MVPIIPLEPNTNNTDHPVEGPPMSVSPEAAKSCMDEVSGCLHGVPI